jgi:anti-anti-sigma factor
LIGALEAGLQGRDPPSAAAIEAAWRGAVALTADLEALNRAFDLLEQAGILQLSAESYDRAAYLRLTEAFQVIRRELMRVRVGHETMQVKYLDSVLSAHTIISNAMLGDVVTRAPSLRWLEVTPATWGCLALWEDDRATLTITSTYLRDDHPLSLNGGQYAAAAFPPAEFMSLPMSHGMDMPVLLSLGTAKRAWGVLALGGAIEIELIGNDPFTAWAGMLGAMFDRMALLAELKEQQQQLSQQQAILQAAYDRERALSSTVREIGCPIIPLMSGVLLVPLIGAIDSDRARQITKTVLDAVSAERATDVLIDVTGVPIIDTQVASVLIQMASMIGLLGGRTVLVGVRPEIAQSIVGLGIDLSQIGTCPTLEVALRLLRQGRDMSPARNGRC